MLAGQAKPDNRTDVHAADYLVKFSTVRVAFRADPLPLRYQIPTQELLQRKTIEKSKCVIHAFQVILMLFTNPIFSYEREGKNFYSSGILHYKHSEIEKNQVFVKFFVLVETARLLWS